MATIRVILTTLDGQPLVSFEVSEFRTSGCLTAADELAIMEGVKTGLEMARTREQEESKDD